MINSKDDTTSTQRNSVQHSGLRRDDNAMIPCTTTAKAAALPSQAKQKQELVEQPKDDCSSSVTTINRDNKTSGHESLEMSIGRAFEPLPLPPNHKHDSTTTRRNSITYIDPKEASTLGEVVDMLFDRSMESASGPAAKRQQASKPKEGESHEPENEKGKKRQHFQSLRAMTNQQRMQAIWDDRYKELVAYQEETGHCSVPTNCKSHLELSRWVKRQRHGYKLQQHGTTSPLTRYRIHKLQQIGFVWDTQALAWDERLEELRIFSKHHGHCNVLHSENPRLATWIKSQRRQYTLSSLGKHSAMTPARIAALESLQLNWHRLKQHVP